MCSLLRSSCPLDAWVAMPSRRISVARVLKGFPLGYPVLTPELQHRVGAAEPRAVRVGGTPPVTFPPRSWGLAARRAAAPQGAGPPRANTRGPQQRSGSRRGLSRVSRPLSSLTRSNNSSQAAHANSERLKIRPFRIAPHGRLPEPALPSPAVTCSARRGPAGET